MARILVIDDDRHHCRFLLAVLCRRGHGLDLRFGAERDRAPHSTDSGRLR
jgi:hypothetical protein